MINPARRKGVQGRRTKLELSDGDSDSDDIRTTLVASGHQDTNVQPVSILKRNIIGRRRPAGGLSSTGDRTASRPMAHSNDESAGQVRRSEDESYSVKEEQEESTDIAKSIVGTGVSRRRAIIERQRKLMSERQVGSTASTSPSGSVGSRANTPSIYTPEELERLKNNPNSIPDTLTIEAIKRKRRSKLQASGNVDDDDGFISLSGPQQEESEKSSGEEGEDELLRQDAQEIQYGVDDGLEGPVELADEEMAIGERAVVTQTERRRRAIAQAIEDAENEDMMEEEELISSSEEEDSDWESQQTHSARWNGSVVAPIMGINDATSGIVLPAIPTLCEVLTELKVTLRELEGSHEMHMQELCNLGDEKREILDRQAQVKKALEQASLDYERVKRPSLLDVVPAEVEEAKMTPTK